MHVPFLDLKSLHREMQGELAAACNRVVESGSYIQGGELQAFEDEFAAYCGTRHCVGVGNGLDALHLILRGYGIGPGDEVIVPANTYIATWLAVSYAGARPVPVEPDPATHNIDHTRLQAAITRQTRAIIAVHLYGRPAAMNEICAIGERHGIKVIEDGAQAHGAIHQGRRTGALGDAAGFSFYPGKNLGAIGDAGAVTTSDTRLAERVRMLRNYGSKKKYEHELAGFNSRLDELQAAFLRTKLKRLDGWNARRQQVADKYLAGLADTGLRLPAAVAGGGSAWHLFVVQSADRDALRCELAQHGVETLIHYPTAPHLQPAYQDLGFGLGAFPIAEELQ